MGTGRAALHAGRPTEVTEVTCIKPTMSRCPHGVAQTPLKVGPEHCRLQQIQNLTNVAASCQMCCLCGRRWGQELKRSAKRKG
jgi:hypothetical protein